MLFMVAVTKGKGLGVLVLVLGGCFVIHADRWLRVDQRSTESSKAVRADS